MGVKRDGLKDRILSACTPYGKWEQTVTSYLQPFMHPQHCDHCTFGAQNTNLIKMITYNRQNDEQYGISTLSHAFPVKMNPHISYTPSK